MGWDLDQRRQIESREALKPATNPNIEYLRRVYANVFEWYRIADSKAQLLLTLDGAFITIIVTNTFAKPDELLSRLDRAGAVGGALVGLAALTIATSVYCALRCLYSRISNAKLKDAHQQLGVAPDNPDTYCPAIAWWFGLIATVSTQSLSPESSRDRGADAYAKLRQKRLTSHMLHRQPHGATTAGLVMSYLLKIDETGEREALASQVVILSSNVLSKHRWVDRGWFCAGLTLIAVVAFGLTYVVGSSQ